MTENFKEQWQEGMPLRDAFVEIKDEDEEGMIKAPNEIKYLLIYLLYDDDKDDWEKGWEFIYGRQEIYNHVKMLCETERLDLEETMIFSETVAIKDALNAREFLRLMKDNYFQDDKFDVSDYEA